MNIYKFELQSVKKSITFWCAILVCTYYFLISGIYPMFEDGMKMIGDLIASMPPEYLLVFGLDPSNMDGYSGFYSFSYSYIALIGTLMATSVTLNIFGKEKKSHAQEFLFTKPVKRKKIFVSKLLATLTAILLFNIVMIAVSLFCFNRYESINTQTILATLALTFSQIIIMGISIFIATFIPKIRTTTSITATIGLVTFILELFINALRIRWLQFFSPLHFFTPKSVFENGGYDTTLVVYGVFILLISIFFAARRFMKSDLNKM